MKIAIFSLSLLSFTALAHAEESRFIWTEGGADSVICGDTVTGREVATVRCNHLPRPASIYSLDNPMYANDRKRAKELMATTLKGGFSVMSKEELNYHVAHRPADDHCYAENTQKGFDECMSKVKKAAALAAKVKASGEPYIWTEGGADRVICADLVSGREVARSRCTHLPKPEDAFALDKPMYKHDQELAKEFKQSSRSGGFGEMTAEELKYHLAHPLAVKPASVDDCHKTTDSKKSFDLCIAGLKKTGIPSSGTGSNDDSEKAGDTTDAN